MAAHRSRSAQLLAALLITLVTMALAPITSGAATTAAGGGAGVGSISGTVTDGLGDPVAGASVTAFDDGENFGFATTEVDGTYTVTGLPASVYTVQADDGVFTSCYGDPTCVSPITVSVFGGFDTPDIDITLGAGAGGTGSISGTVTDGAGDPIEGAQVDASGDTTFHYGSTFSAADGTYTITDLVVDTYTVSVYTVDAYECYDDDPSCSTPTPVPVEDATDTPNIDFVLDGGGTGGSGSIAGTVTDSGGDPIEGVDVNAYGSIFGFGSATTAADGTYTITGLDDDDYTVEFTPPLDSLFVSEYYNDKAEFFEADPVAVAGGGAVTSIDAELAAAGGISGTVLDEAGDPIPDVAVSADSDGGFGGGFASTAADGTYSLTGLAVGDYRVEFSPDSTTAFIGEYFDDAPDYSTADLVAITEGVITPDIDATLAEGGTISGTVTGPGGGAVSQADVSITTPGGEFVGYASTELDGTYVSPALHAGTYFVQFLPPFDSPLLGEYFDDAPSRATATPVVVLAGTDTPGIDAELIEGGTISGTVTRPGGAAVANAPVYVYGLEGGNAVTAADGSYTVNGLAPGSYQVQFLPPVGSDLVGEYYDDWFNATNADQVAVGLGSDVTAINAELTIGGSISGTVTDGASAAVAGATVRLTGFGINPKTAITDATGAYTITGIVPSSFYTLSFTPLALSPLLPETYNNVHPPDAPTFLTVGSGDALTGLDAQLEMGGTIAGTVTGPGGPSAGVTVWVGSKNATTALDGTYSVIGLPTGSYTVRFDAAPLSGLLDEYFDNQPTSLTANPVAVTAGATTSDIDALLAAGGGISGTVTAAGGAPAADVLVYANSTASGPGGSATTDAAGAYTIAPLAPGDYTISFVPDSFFGGSDLVGEFYDDALDFDDATPVTVAGTATVSGIDAELAIGGRVAGTVTGPTDAPIGGVAVSIDGDNGNQFTFTESDGTYDVGGLLAGDYTVGFFATGFETQFYDGVTSSTLATPVAVTLGTTQSGIDAKLSDGASISGTVTDAAGDPIPDIEVYADNIGFGPVDVESRGPRSAGGQATTAADGTYTVVGLDAGDYLVSFDDLTGVYRSEYFDDQPTFATADPVSVAGGADVTAIDAELALVTAEITGTITGTVVAGAVGVPGASVTVLQGGTQRGLGFTEPDGDYKIDDLAPGSYQVHFQPPEGTGLAFEYFDDKATLASANAVTVTANTTTDGIDANLGAAGSIAGMVTGEGGGPLYAYVTVFATDGSVASDGFTEFDGSYLVSGLRAGNYKVQFEPFFADTHQSEYYDDAASFAAADLVVVTAGATTNDIDAVLAEINTHTAPTKPINATASAGNAQATVDWDAPASDGGSPITGYTVTAAPGGATANVGGGVTVATVTGLTNGTSYTFTVTATNAIGTSPPSDATNSVTPTAGTTAPSKPLNATASSGNTQAVVDWDPPSSTGGSPITGYTVTAAPGGATANVGGSVTVATVTGLTNGTGYTFTVTATNAIGTSPPSDPSNAVVPSGGGSSECDGLPVTVRALFTDVPPDHPFCEDIEWLVDEGVTTGYPDGSFRPGGSVTRMAMAAFIYRYAGEPAFSPPATPTFTDVPSSHPFFKEIEWMVAEEITGGFPDGTFRPGGSITRQAMAAFMYRMAGEPAFTPPGSPSFPDVSASHPFYDEIEWMVAEEITGGFPDGTFRPAGTVTRQAMAAFLHRFDDAFGGIVV